MELLYGALIGYLLGSYFISGLFIKDWILEPSKLPVKGTWNRLGHIVFMPILLIGIFYYLIKNKFT